MKTITKTPAQLATLLAHAIALAHQPALSGHKKSVEFVLHQVSECVADDADETSAFTEHEMAAILKEEQVFKDLL